MLQHDIMFAKLERYGIRGNCLDWVRSYLSNREMRVKCRVSTDGKYTTSANYKVNCDTSQGLCLEPLLFLIFCNDLSLHLTFLNTIQFTDDTTLYQSSKNLNYIKHCTTLDLQILQDWFCANKLTLNVEKSICMLFSPKGKTGKHELKVATKSVPCVRSAKFLDLRLDDELNWQEHFNKLMIKLK